MPKLDQGEVGIAAREIIPVFRPGLGERLSAVGSHLDAARQICTHGLRLTDQMRAEIAVRNTARAAMTAGSSINMRASDSLDQPYVHIMFRVGQR
jgi:hypothetical protein